jgi:hypothetical protein
MNWQQASNLIAASITQGLHLDPRRQFKIVINVPPYKCYRNGFNGLIGYRVQVGKNSVIEIPFDVLWDIHSIATLNNINLYNKNVFQYRYLHLYQAKPCYVHTVGKIFTMSGVALQINKTEYQML